MYTNRRLSLVAVLCAAAASVMIACGGSGPSAPSTTATTTTSTTTTPTTPTPTTPSMPLLESLPVNLATLDYAAIVAHRTAFDAEWLPLGDFGFIIPASSVRPTPQANPQPTFYAPLGTPVVAIVSGVVTSITTLYSSDFSVMVGASSGSSGPFWEMEHVINVRVRVGDTVVAGQTIADVSNYECAWARNSLATDPICLSRLGLVEMGLLYGGATPEHRCPFDTDVVAPSKQDAIFGQLDAARARIEAAFGDASKYNEVSRASSQCITLARVPG